jgi:hypothetical protein
MPGQLLGDSFGCVGVPISGLVNPRGSKPLSAIVDIRSWTGGRPKVKCQSGSAPPRAKAMIVTARTERLERFSRSPVIKNRKDIFFPVFH